MNEATMSRVADQSQMKNRLIAAGLALTLPLGAMACGKGQDVVSLNQQPGTTVGTGNVPGTGPGTTMNAAPSTTEFKFDGNAGDGRDKAIRDEDDAGLYDCGGKKGETWKNEDGSVKPYDPDYRIQHMNAHETLPKSDYDLWTDQFSAEGLKFLAEKGVGNSQHDENLKVTSPDVPQEFSEFMGKQVASVMKTNELAKNFACKDAAGNYHEFPVNVKQLIAGESTLTGIVLSEDNYKEFVEIAKRNGKNLKEIFIQELNVDTDGNGEGDKKFFMIFTNNEMCGNPQLKMPPSEIPPTVTTTINTVPNTPTTPRVTVTAPPSVTTTSTPNTTIGPKENPHPPVTGGAPTTVEAPEPQPNPVPTTAPRNPNTTVAPTQPTQTPVNNPTTSKPPGGIPDPGLEAKFAYTVSQ